MSSQGRKIRILLIEDNRLLREGIAATLNAQPDLRVTSTSGGGQKFSLLTSKPDVVLLDLGLRNQNGLGIVKSLASEFPDVKVIGMGLIPSQQDIVELVEAGAAGFLLKDATILEVLGTIRSVAGGTKVVPPPLTGSLFSYVIEQALKRRNRPLNNMVRMTKREREIIALIADGLSNKAIAQRLRIATYTVKSHVHNIMEKLALHSRLEIAKQTLDRTTP